MKQFLNSRFEPHGHGSLRPSFSISSLKPRTMRSPRLTCVSDGDPLRRLLVRPKKGAGVWIDVVCHTAISQQTFFGVDFNSTCEQFGGMQQDFGCRLRELRQARGMTLRALAEAAGVDFTYLSKIENGRAGYLPGAETIRDLAQALEVDSID